MVVALLSNRLQAKATHCAVPVGCGHTDTSLGAVVSANAGVRLLLCLCTEGQAHCFPAFLWFPPTSTCVFPKYLSHRRSKKSINFLSLLLPCVCLHWGKAGCEAVWESGCQPGPFTTHQSGGSRTLIDCSLDNNRISGVTTPALSINKQVSQQILAFAFLSASSVQRHFYSSVETYNEVSRQTQHGGGDCLPQCLCRIRRMSSDWQQINRRWELCLFVFLQIIDVPVPVTAVEWDASSHCSRVGLHCQVALWRLC